MIIKTKNLVLRPYRKGDAKALFENFNDRRVTHYLSDAKHPYTMKDARDWIAKCRKFSRKRPRTEIVFVIEKDHDFIGSIDLKKIKWHKAELGYWIGRKYWNRGIMTEAVKAVTKMGFRDLKLKRIYACIYSKNRISAKVLEKNGFRKEGLLKKDRVKDGKLIDIILYAKIK